MPSAYQCPGTITIVDLSRAIGCPGDSVGLAPRVPGRLNAVGMEAPDFFGAIRWTSPDPQPLFVSHSSRALRRDAPLYR
jgi:hypothetical protein